VAADNRLQGEYHQLSTITFDVNYYITYILVTIVQIWSYIDNFTI